MLHTAIAKLVSHSGSRPRGSHDPPLVRNVRLGMIGELILRRSTPRMRARQNRFRLMATTTTAPIRYDQLILSWWKSPIETVLTRTLRREIVNPSGYHTENGFVPRQSLRSRLSVDEIQGGIFRELVELLIERKRPSSLLDPFSGIGTAPLTAAAQGINATGIEVIPVGLLVGQAISLAANNLERNALAKAGTELLGRIESKSQAPSSCRYPHVAITEKAFPAETELDLAKARAFISTLKDPDLATMLNLACMSVLESVSFTQKDGQFLRWDRRSGKSLSPSFEKKTILRFKDALERRLREMCQDLEELTERYGKTIPQFIAGSCLQHLKTLPTGSFDMVITSPPYLNRYDYTRTYALELAWLGIDHEGFRALRQKMLSSTVENQSKQQWLVDTYTDATVLESAVDMYENQNALHEVLEALRGDQNQLSNRRIVQMIEGYFLEMSVVISELGRIVVPGGTVAMINDNVQYHGQELPVDIILSDFAEQAGFVCEWIWTLPRGKGNPSQQMSRFGRHEQRKCVYWWVRDGY